MKTSRRKDGDSAIAVAIWSHNSRGATRCKEDDRIVHERKAMKRFSWTIHDRRWTLCLLFYNYISNQSRNGIRTRDLGINSQSSNAI